MDISEKSENHLKAIVEGLEMAGLDGVRERAGKVAEKTQGEGKVAKSGARGWQSAVGCANYIDLRDIDGCHRLSLSFLSRGIALDQTPRKWCWVRVLESRPR